MSNRPRLKNGATFEIDPELLLPDAGIYPWIVDDGKHEDYLNPNVPRGMPRVIHPETEATFDEELSGFWVRTTWLGDGNGGVARSPWNDPMVRALTFVRHETNPAWEVWMIADGTYNTDDIVLPVRITTAMTNGMLRSERAEAVEWALEIMNNPMNYFFGKTDLPSESVPLGHPTLRQAQERTPSRRDAFRSARSLYRFAYPPHYPKEFKELLVFERSAPEILNADRGDPERAERRYAAVGLAAILARVLREPCEDGAFHEDPIVLFGKQVGKSRATAFKLIQEAVNRGVLSEPVGGRGRRYLTPKGREILFSILGRVHDDQFNTE